MQSAVCAQGNTALVGAAAGWLLFASAALAQVIPVTGGAIHGSQPKDGGLLFRGIPFAAPPVGALRWKPPQPVIPWKAVREATEQPASCIQNDQGWNTSDYVIGKEDCLTLDVRTPSLGGKLPVLVWIHGGSNRAGGPNDIVLSDVGKQVVIVGVRYRLGIFGFLSHPALTAEQGGSGNYGIMDQVAALRWVHDNIAKFGGDPGNITIAGESAGSQDVSLLLAAPAARGLFEKAIMESGTPGFGMTFRSLKEAERIGMQADDMLKAGGSIEKMRQMSVPALLAVDLKLHDENMQSDDMMWLRTTVDEKLFASDPRTLLESAPPRPVIAGTNKIEFGSDRPHRDSIIAREFGPNEAAARAYYHADQPNPPEDPRLGSLDEQIGTDVVFRCPTEHLAQLLTILRPTSFKPRIAPRTTGSGEVFVQGSRVPAARNWTYIELPADGGGAVEGDQGVAHGADHGSSPTTRDWAWYDAVADSPVARS